MDCSVDFVDSRGFGSVLRDSWSNGSGLEECSSRGLLAGQSNRSNLWTETESYRPKLTFVKAAMPVPVFQKTYLLYYQKVRTTELSKYMPTLPALRSLLSVTRKTAHLGLRKMWNIHIAIRMKNGSKRTSGRKVWFSRYVIRPQRLLPIKPNQISAAKMNIDQCSWWNGFNNSRLTYCTANSRSDN